MRAKNKKLIIVAILVISITIPSFVILLEVQANNGSSNIKYFNLIDNTFQFSDSEKEKLTQNKFIVLNRKGTDDIIDAYKFYWENDLPIFITTDTMLHIWHLIFDRSLEKIEELVLFPLLKNLVDNMTLKGLVEYNKGVLMNETLLYLVVASNLINSTTIDDLPSEIYSASEMITNAIFNEISLESAINQFNTLYTRRFIDDFSQYKPRGHYTKTKILETYFRLYKWFSRIPFFFDDYGGIRFLQINPSKLIESSLEVTWLLKETTIEYFENLITGLEIWSVFKEFLDALVGPTNTISPLMLHEICSDLIGFSWNISEFNEIFLSQVQETALNDTTISSPKIPFIIDARAGYSSSPKTFTLFGERFTFDSYALNNFVNSERGLPSSLDFAAACLDSNRSFELLEPEFANYPWLHDRILNIQEEIKYNFTIEEKSTTNWKWVESLKQIAVDKPECNESILLPEFMNSTSWLDEKLTTIMGSWTQLKHDFILYSRQSATPFCSTPSGYVEPYPSLYRSLRALVQNYKNSLLPIETLGFDFANHGYNYIGALDAFSNATLMLEEISRKELTGTELNQEEKEFIINTYSENQAYGGPLIDGWLVQIFNKLDSVYRVVNTNPNTFASLVADIHTDTNTGNILHLATGVLEQIIAIVPGWDDREIAVVGPVFSFYEFPLPDYQRLTDQEWRAILYSCLDVDSRDSQDFYVYQRGFWAANYMVSTEMTTSFIFLDESNTASPYDDTPINGIKHLVSGIAISAICVLLPVIIIWRIVKKRRKYF